MSGSPTDYEQYVESLEAKLKIYTNEKFERLDHKMNAKFQDLRNAMIDTNHKQKDTLEAKLKIYTNEKFERLDHKMNAKFQVLKNAMIDKELSFLQKTNNLNDTLDETLNEVQRLRQNIKFSKSNYRSNEYPSNLGIDPDVLEQWEILKQQPSTGTGIGELISEISKIIAQQTQLILLPHLTELLFLALAYFMVSDYRDLFHVSLAVIGVIVLIIIRYFF
ncbi:putative membrane protein [Wickerhamomyces ciferrii]|uniref:Membrane protein n=1 Tax=Wickerhamomyces ciferrii (strain ATCC 14091 / BCRC 22168 / CBS 111 / JCM 3599 / NBRC 0793 / NRRL Y-1031 F-60-10) TaxID=1206466 RepID=K0KJH8_WICCF|nr:uncharacterized protein BN7_2678 [Wickerhamomyces ciferrii]CCH43131.1 putative membrane protein [Wickerhamomyces ciferrii]